MTNKSLINQVHNFLAMTWLTLLCVTLVACVTQEKSAVADIKNTYWKLIRVADKDIPSVDNSRQPHILLNDDNRVTGSDGCNRLMGSYQLNANQLHFGQLASTRMACLDGGDYAMAFANALTKTVAFTITGDQLQLLDVNNNVIAELVKQEKTNPVP